ncbi:NAD(P)/FAD-dependent oxidoreductase [Sneathiella litorea]|uniref:FAD-dependent oxidoreductase n=1 Tax=Sneathiella litorea TaxID=2606216 RepID=A0A6L8W9A3_9PROT|nr:FAD-binding oxidoreductase [Sneathiella litorea]MZR31073.1 FAD-dependent oxidoreductase [Sneathiella litorea]
MNLSYYDASAAARAEYPRLKGAQNTDVCIVGAGYTGLCAALDLAEAGFSVVVLEAERIGFGASGRNGGQIATGYSPGMIDTEALVGADDAARLWDLSVEAIRLLKDRIARHNIDCDLKAGELYAAVKPRHRDWLLEEKAHCEKYYGYNQYQWIEPEEMGGFLETERFCGGLLDSSGGHLHPLNYALGLGKAAQDAGVTIYENSRVLEVREGTSPLVTTAEGSVKARYVILAGNAYLADLDHSLAAKIIPVDACIVATEPLGEKRARSLMKTEACVSDTNFNLDYFRMSADHRLLYGGQDKLISKREMAGAAVRENMLVTFPQMEDVKIDYVWGGKVAVTRVMLPDVGRKGRNIYYAHGYSGQGVPLSAIVGRLLAEAIGGDAERFDVFARIPHKPFPGGTALRVPLLSIARLYYELKDAL